MQLELVDGRANLDVLAQVQNAVALEVAHANGAETSLPHKCLECPPCPEDIAIGHMNQVEVKVVQAQRVKGTQTSLARLAFPHVLDKDLGRDEQFCPGKTRTANSRAHGGLILVRGSRVNQTITHLQGLRDRAFAHVRRHLKDPETNHRHLRAGIQFDCLHKTSLNGPQYTSWSDL